MLFNPKHKVSTGHARKLHQNYQNRRPKPHKDTMAVWFPKTLLETALKSSDPAIEISGLRFYMGAYEKDHDDWPRDHRYKEMVTLICVQTRTEGSGSTVIERDILDDDDAPPKYDPIKQGFEFNDGQLCPPGTGCDDEGLGNFPPLKTSYA